MLKIVSNYTLTQYISKGQYGKVYKAINHKTSQYVAIKMISLDKFIERPKLIELTKQQIDILSKLQNNQNVIKFKEIIKTNRFLYIVYEYCNGGTLEEYLRKNGQLQERQAIKLFKQLVNGYRPLYESNIVHRDIKPDNILFKDSKLKLADFGFCKKLKFSEDLTQTSLGSPLYMAPQVLNHDVYGSKADLWSCGIILYQMIFGCCPYGTFNIKELLMQYSLKDQLPIPTDKRYLSATLIQMLRRILCKDQFRRISWQEFFYEYSFTDSGQIKHKIKDFEYDLMKLMKKNSSSENTENNQTESVKSLKFDWSKITDLNSSVHSEDCSSNDNSNMNREKQHPNNYNHSKQSFSTSRDHQINQQTKISLMYNLKKQIKSFQTQHSKILQLITLIESLLESTKDYEYDSRVIYFLVYNLQKILSKNINSIKEYLELNNSLLSPLYEQKNKLQKLQRIFLKQHQVTKPKLNNIKSTLLSLQDIGQDVLRYPRNNVMRKVMKQYIQNFQIFAQHSTELNEQGNRQECVRLLKILWGVVGLGGWGQKQKNNKKGDQNLQNKRRQEGFSYSSMPTIRQETPVRDISAMTNRYLVEIGI